MIKKIFIYALTLLSGITYAEKLTISELIISKLENNPNWIQLNNDNKREKLNRSLISENYQPYFSIGNDGTNFYSLGNIKDTIYHNLDISTYLNWWTPLDGTVTIGVRNSFSISKTDEEYTFSQNPLFTLRYAQPFWLSGKLIDPSLYKKSKELLINNSMKESELKFLITENSIILDLLNDYINIRSILREINLNEARLNLAEEELEFSRINRKNGTSSGSDFWKKQIEVQNLKDSILENRETLTYKLKIFCDNLKIPDNYFIDSFIQEDLPQLPEIPPNKSNYQNLKTQLKLIEFEKDKLQVDIERKKYASQLTASFSLNPQYGERDNKTSLSDSFNFTSNKSYINYNFSLNLNFSSKEFQQEKIDRERNSLNINTLVENLNQIKQKSNRDTDLLYKKVEFLKANVDRKLENLKLAKSLYNEEEKYFEVGKSSQLLKRVAKLNLTVKESEFKQAKDELYMEQLQLLSEIGLSLKEIITKGI